MLVKSAGCGLSRGPTKGYARPTLLVKSGGPRRPGVVPLPPVLSLDRRRARGTSGQSMD